MFAQKARADERHAQFLKRHPDRRQRIETLARARLDANQMTIPPEIQVTKDAVQ
ncbi:hypothetical protein [Jiella mangrovi]|uniref:Uncharacterized protein n=1 Tax=Jiella mangrovi TaxID=2821407 RepID=A0ABS4BHX1_9HYPH|nr:hypothetical protein [Jiella mangrovi]MBP0616343.1 hypothetical protein [Jiella mangrovi]